MKNMKKTLVLASLLACTFAHSAELYMAGDSIMTDYKPTEWPQFGWGQSLKSFMKSPENLHNFARSGWSARRFRESGRWEDCIASKLKPGHWVIVSFGHNDSNRRRNKPPKNDYSTIDEYKAFLKGFAADVKAKDANIAFATSIAHSDGFSVKDGAMNVDGGAKGLGAYVNAMRELAAETGAPLLDLNRYAEENLPKLGIEKAKSLYMFVKPGEYANYPKGKQDAAHIRDAGAFFYAKGAVEMARAQGLSLADLLKDPAIVPFVPVVAPVAFADAKVFRAVSPDGKNELRLEVGGNGMEYSVWRSGKAIVESMRIALKVEGRGWLNGTGGSRSCATEDCGRAGARPSRTTREIKGTLATPLYKKSSIDLAANETKVDFGDWAVRLHARNDGVAWRFETKFGGEITVNAESTNIRFPKGAELCYTVAPGFMSGWEKPAQIGPVESVPAGHTQIVMTPFTATVPGAGVVTVTESDLRDYPGLNFYRREGEQDTLRSWQAGVPKDVDKGRRKIKVVNREPYLAKTKGTRSFPWRVFVFGDTPGDLVESDAVYALATPHSQLPHSPTPHSSTDFSWVKPGQVAWDWWNGFQITDVPGLNTGCNFKTYREYVNFAAANGIAYIIMDEGWSEKLDLDKPRDEVNVPGVIAYAREKGVGVILWAAWSPLTDRETRLRVFDRYAAMGAKGFKIDFIERDDQDVERFLEETAADAAERKLVVMYHGIHKPTGLQRTYPNILNYEGVYGLEQGGRSGGRKVVVSNDVNLVYTRMVAGFMDYTPGAMRNRAFDAPPYDKEKDTRVCYGTRCHQLALFPLFEAPIQMLCDSPTQYRSEPECTAFITKVPTVWDETRGVAGAIGKFAAVARRKGREWWLGAITNWERRELELSTKFLGEGEWKVDAFEDASDAGVNAEHYVRRVFTVKAGEPLKVRLAPGGGFAAKFKRKKTSIRVMTYNIRYSEGDRESPKNNWNVRKDDLVDLIVRENPDVVGFQEVLPEQMEFLKSRLSSYTFVGEYRNADRKSGEASPIAFKSNRFNAVKCGTFWLSETPDAAGSISWGAKYPRVCSYAVLDDAPNGRRFAFANTHTDHRSEAAREKGMLLVIERMKEFSNNAPVVFVGDHNCLEYEAPSVAVSKILKDAMYLSETPPEGSWRTFNYWSYKEKELSIVEALEKPVRERSEPGDKSDQKRIDYIYVSPGTRVLGYRTIPDTRPGVKLYPSDHFPSVAEIVIGATPAEPCVVEVPGSAKLVFDTSNAPDLRAWTEEKFAPAMCEWVVRLTEIMMSDGWEPPKEILFQFVFERLQSCTNAAAWASTWKNTVNLRVDWFRKNLDGEALGATVHELTHIMQGYWSKKGITNENCPSWASEGYADYIRWILFEPESDGCGYIRKNPKKYHYNDSYRVTAHFFGFVESCYPGTMKKLNAALRDHTFDNGKFWQDATGKPVETLEADWKASIK